MQAVARVHRHGQTKPVQTYRMICGGTVEDRIQNRAEAKLYLVSEHDSPEALVLSLFFCKLPDFLG